MDGGAHRLFLARSLANFDLLATDTHKRTLTCALHSFLSLEEVRPQALPEWDKRGTERKQIHDGDSCHDQAGNVSHERVRTV